MFSGAGQRGALPSLHEGEGLDVGLGYFLSASAPAPELTGSLFGAAERKCVGRRNDAPED